MIKPKSKPKLNKEENLRKKHREYLKKQGVSLDKDYRNMTYEEKQQYKMKGAEAAGNLLLSGFEYSPGGIGFKGVSAGIKLARNPKMVKKLLGKVVKKITKKKTKKKKPSAAQKDYKQQSSLQRESGAGSTSRIGKMSPKGKFTPKKKPKRLN